MSADGVELRICEFGPSGGAVLWCIGLPVLYWTLFSGQYLFFLGFCSVLLCLTFYSAVEVVEGPSQV